MKIIVDTNIIFSAILNTNGIIGEIIFDSDAVFEFYSCSYMRYEIDKHWSKLKRISKLSDEDIKESLFRIFTKIHFINEDLIPSKIWLKAEALMSLVDIDFVALTTYMDGILWTGDKALYNGLKKKGFKKVLNTQELLKIKLSQ